MGEAGAERGLGEALVNARRVVESLAAAVATSHGRSVADVRWHQMEDRINYCMF